MLAADLAKNGSAGLLGPAIGQALGERAAER